MFWDCLLCYTLILKAVIRESIGHTGWLHSASQIFQCLNLALFKFCSLWNFIFFLDSLKYRTHFFFQSGGPTVQAFIDFNHLLHSGPACLSFVKHTSCVFFEALS